MLPSRPVLRYHGGKWRLAPWICSHFPAHRVYVEPFGGAASVLIRKAPCYSEVYNDRDGDVCNVFGVLRSPDLAEVLRRRLELTPFSRDEFLSAYEAPADLVDRARKTIVRAFMGFGSASTNPAHVTGFRANANKSGTTPAHDWQNWPSQIPAFVARLRGVIVENRDALEVILQQDSERTLFYVDPPYPHGTRARRGHADLKLYPYEMTDADHRRLGKVLTRVAGMVVLSGYACEMYERIYAGWRRVEVAALADGARPRTEVLWINAAAATALDAAAGVKVAA